MLNNLFYTNVFKKLNIKPPTNSKIINIYQQQMGQTIQYDHVKLLSDACYKEAYN
jgi:hypothetical protein